MKTIADGLRLLGNLHPAVLLISGTCHENVVVQGLNSITLQGSPIATVDGGTNPDVSAAAIRGFLNNLTITGSGQGVGCLGVSYCLLSQVTIENSLGDGVDVQGTSRLEITDSVVQNNAANGLGIAIAGVFFGGSITGNGSDGVFLRNGGFFASITVNATPSID